MAHQPGKGGRETGDPTSTQTSIEQHFSPGKLAALWDLSTGSIRSLFRDEPGVIIIDRPEEMHIDWAKDKE